MRALSTLIPVLAAALLAGGALVAERQAADPDPGVRYVDLQLCLDSYVEAQQGLVRMNQYRDGRKAEFEERGKALMARQDELQTMDQGSSAYLEEAYKIKSAESLLQGDYQFVQQQLQDMETELLVRTWLAVQRAAAEVRAREGFGAVMVVPKDLPPELLQGSIAPLDALPTRTLMSATPTYDASELVIASLNPD